MTRTIVAVEAITLDENTDYAQLLRSLMDDSGVKVADLSRQLGNSQNLISMWRHGKRAPSVMSLARLADAFGFELTLTPKPPPVEVLRAPEPARPVDRCPASTSGLCLSMTEGFALCEADDCVHHPSGTRAEARQARTEETS